MPNNKTKSKKYLSLFVPSSFGIVIYVSLAGLTIVLNQLDSIKGHLELPASWQLSRIFTGWADTFLTHTIGVSRTDTLVVGSFWAVVGLLVYIMLRGLAKLVIELDDGINVKGYVWPKGEDRAYPLRHFFQQLAWRLGALIMLLVVVFGPLAVILHRPVYVSLIGPTHLIAQDIVWFFVSVLMWHVVTVLLRLMLLRDRIFG